MYTFFHLNFCLERKKYKYNAIHVCGVVYVCPGATLEPDLTTKLSTRDPARVYEV